MKHYYVGCSLTYGDDLPADKREHLTWAGLVAKHYNADFVNGATPGGSNQRTVDKVIENINNFDKFYIQWTYRHRFTLYDPTNWYEINFVNNLSHDLYKDVDYYQTFGKYYYVFWSSPLFEFKAWLRQVILLQRYLESNNKSYLMWCGVPTHYESLSTRSEQEFLENIKEYIDIDKFSDSQIFEQHKEIQGLLSQIDFNNFISPSVFNAFRSVFQKYPVGPTQHPLEEGNQEIADFIINYEKEKK
jgi:hypothetical protein